MSQIGLTIRASILASAAVVAMAVSAGNVVAQPVDSGNRVPSFTKLPDSAISQFKADPKALLTTYASAGLPLSTEVRSLVLSDPSLVDKLIDVAKIANNTQMAAIGAGLAEAARILVATNPQVAARIQLAVAQSGCVPSEPGKPDCSGLVTAFLAGSNGTRTAATGGVGAGGGGGLGGGGGGGGSGGPTGGVGNTVGSNSGSNPGGSSFGSLNAGSSFGALGGVGAGGGGLIAPSVSPSAP